MVWDSRLDFPHPNRSGKREGRMMAQLWGLPSRSDRALGRNRLSLRVCPLTNWWLSPDLDAETFDNCLISPIRERFRAHLPPYTTPLFNFTRLFHRSIAAPHGFILALFPLCSSSMQALKPLRSCIGMPFPPEGPNLRALRVPSPHQPKRFSIPALGIFVVM